MRVSPVTLEYILKFSIVVAVWGVWQVVQQALTLVLNGEVAPHMNHYKFGYGLQVSL
jgi:hypothetical protein